VSKSSQGHFYSDSDQTGALPGERRFGARSDDWGARSVLAMELSSISVKTGVSHEHPSRHPLRQRMINRRQIGPQIFVPGVPNCNVAHGGITAISHGKPASVNAQEMAAVNSGRERMDCAIRPATVKSGAASMSRVAATRASLSFPRRTVEATCMAYRRLPMRASAATAAARSKLPLEKEICDRQGHLRYSAQRIKRAKSQCTLRVLDRLIVIVVQSTNHRAEAVCKGAVAVERERLVENIQRRCKIMIKHRHDKAADRQG
jgi:hypothetical protein